jgi:hypothetical protein
MRALIVATALLAVSCDCVHCLALRRRWASLSLVDEQGSGVQPGAGAIAFEGTTTPFDCAPGLAAPLRVECTDAGLIIETMNEPSELSITVKELDGGREFVGDVQLTYAVVGELCGGPCRKGSATITLR